MISKICYMELMRVKILLLFLTSDKKNSIFRFCIWCCEEHSFLSKCIAILVAYSSGFLFTEFHFAPKLLPTPSQIPSVTLANHEQILHQDWINPNKRDRAPHIRNRNVDLWSILCACCAHLPVHPSKEVNFALARQFSISLSLIVTLVVFRGFISNNLGCSSGIIPSRGGAQKPLAPRETCPLPHCSGPEGSRRSWTGNSFQA
jgi:hypothetical protein